MPTSSHWVRQVLTILLFSKIIPVISCQAVFFKQRLNSQLCYVSYYEKTPEPTSLLESSRWRDSARNANPARSPILQSQNFRKWLLSPPEWACGAGIRVDLHVRRVKSTKGGGGGGIQAADILRTFPNYIPAADQSFISFCFVFINHTKAHISRPNSSRALTSYLVTFLLNLEFSLQTPHAPKWPSLNDCLGKQSVAYGTKGFHWHRVWSISCFASIAMVASYSMLVTHGVKITNSDCDCSYLSKSFSQNA